jgi:hypothetical protein
MSSQQFVDPVHNDAVATVDNAVAIGEDLAFQERWWKFEHIIWVFFALVLIADALGAFGRGWLANAELKAPSSAMDIRYERVERVSTPSIITINFAPEAVNQGKVQLFASDSIVQKLGADRVIPQPEQSSIGNGGITYTFAGNNVPATVQFELQPPAPGIYNWTLQVPGQQPVNARVVVMP